MSVWASLLLGAPRPASELAPLDLDLRQRTIAGLDGSATRDLVEKRLGPPTRFWARRRGLLHYDQLGLLFQLDDARVVCGFSVFFAGVVGLYRFDGRREPPRESGVTALLGAPTSREVDDEEVMLEWRRDPTFLGIDFALDGTLVDLFVDFR